MNYLQSCGKFIRELFRDFHHTGAILPSSRFLARAMCRPLRQSDRPRPASILEVGPGTGAVTAEIVRQLAPGDRLDIVEINSRFVALLEQRFAAEPLFRKKRRQLTLVHAAVQSLPLRPEYDFILSGLPLNNFSAALVRELFRVFRKLLRPQGTLSFFEYILVRELKTPFVGQAERRRLAQVARIVGKYVKEAQVSVQAVVANAPPAWVRHMCFHGS